MALENRNHWKALPYDFEYTSKFNNTIATGIMTFTEGVTYNLLIERKIPTNENGKDTRTSRQKRCNNGFNYSIVLDGIDFLNIDTLGFNDEKSALDEIAVLITMELEDMKPEEMSVKVRDLVQIIKLQAEGV